jgi:hypothetical protein
MSATTRSIKSHISIIHALSGRCKQTTTTTDDTYQVVGTLTAGGTLAITNAGLFDAVSSGNLFVKGDFSTINLSTGDSIQFTFKTQFS